MRDDLRVAVEAVVADSEPHPNNESETCFRVIYPLLLAAGYGAREVKSQDLDAAKQKPDFTILPDCPEQTWFLEAKAWTVTLDDNHAAQAINYANTQGKRWVVLSNGREWRLYDNHIIGTPEVKLACKVELADGDFAAFLEAISRSSVVQAKLEGFVRNQRLYSALARELSVSDSDVVKALVKVLKARPGLSGVGSGDVAGFFKSYGSGLATVNAPPIAEPVSGSAPDPTRPGMEGRALGSIPSAEITGRKPRLLEFPDGTVAALPNWAALPVELAVYLLRRDAMPPLPVYSGHRSKSPLIARRDSPGFGKMRDPRELPEPFSGVFVECHFSASSHQLNGLRLLEQAGLDPASFRLVLG